MHFISSSLPYMLEICLSQLMFQIDNVFYFHTQWNFLTYTHGYEVIIIIDGRTAAMMCGNISLGFVLTEHVLKHTKRSTTGLFLLGYRADCLHRGLHDYIYMVDSSKHKEKAKNRGNPESMTRSRLRSYLNQNILK